MSEADVQLTDRTVGLLEAIEMLDLEETFVYDSVVHAYNFTPENYRNEQHAEPIREMIYMASAAAVGSIPEGHFITRDAFMHNWSPQEVAEQLFYESDTDMATFQPLPLYAFEDGLCANENAAEVMEKWPDRFTTFATIDPLTDDWEESFEKQVEWFDPVGLKLYPSSWTENDHTAWRMNDQDVAYPVFEKAKELGLDFVAVHKAVPFGPAPRDPYNPEDVDQPAENFPEIDFGIVHGGLSFTEETAWQLARFPNVHACLEAVGIQAAANPDVFGDILSELVKVGGPAAYDQMYWSSAAVAFHPQIQLEAIRDFEYTDEQRKKGHGGKIPQITDEDKRKILGQNYADLLGTDVDEAKSKIESDEFAETVRSEGKAEPWATANIDADAII